MEIEHVGHGWTVRGTVPGPDVPLLSVEFFVDEYRVTMSGSSTGPGIRMPRRGLIRLAAEHQPAWLALLARAPDSKDLVLREPAGRNHEVRMGWPPLYPPLDVTASEAEIVVPWVALDLEVFAEIGRPRAPRKAKHDPWA